jgi:hypothetical protein
VSRHAIHADHGRGTGVEGESDGRECALLW